MSENTASSALNVWKDKLKEADFGITVELERDLKHRLEGRPHENFSPSDSDLFYEYIKSYVVTAVLPQFASIYRSKVIDILEVIQEYERKNSVKVNKEQLYFSLAILAAQENDEAGILMNFERARREHSKAASTPFNLEALMSDLQSMLSSVVIPCERAFNALSLIRKLRSGSLTSPTFSDVLDNLSGPNLGQFIVCCIRLVRVLEWLREKGDFSGTRLLGLELTYSLCVLYESALKVYVGRPDDTISKLLQNSKIGIRVRRRIGQLRTAYPVGDVPKFNRNLPGILQELERSNSTADLTATSLYAAVSVRDKVLHGHHEKLGFYENRSRFEDVVSALFLAVASISVME